MTSVELAVVEDAAKEMDLKLAALMALLRVSEFYCLGSWFKMVTTAVSGRFISRLRRACAESCGLCMGLGV